MLIKSRIGLVVAGGICGAIVRVFAAALLIPWIGNRNPWLWTALTYMSYVIGIAALCWPLRSVARVSWCSLGASLGVTVTAVVLTLGRRDGSPEDVLRQIVLPPILLLAYWIVPFILLAPVVLMVNKIAPILAAGHCIRCDYDLRGLSEPCCPKCGAALEPEAVPLRTHDRT